MPSPIRTLIGAAMLAVAHGQGVILSAKGDSGTSKGLQVNPDDQNDANFISDAEITANVVNECGRTLAAGNIDIGATTEDILAAKEVTQVKSGGKVTMTIDQRNANGTGPYACDLDPTSNANGATGQTALDTQNGDAKGGNGQMTLTVTMPKDLACIGASTGDVCTIRCRNAQDFGGCVAVQQTDTNANSTNDPAKITAAQSLKAINAQIQQNKIDLEAAIQGNQQPATSDGQQSLEIANAILAADSAIGDSVQKELATNSVDTAAPANTAATGNNNNNNNKNNGNGNGNGNGNKKGNGNGNKNNGNAAQAATGGNGNNRGAQTGGNGNGNGNGRNRNNNNNNKRESPSVRRLRRFRNAVAGANQD